MRIAAFEKCLEIILRFEGGETLTNDPNDPGGVTKWGISKRAYPSADIANLTREQAAQIYHDDYWNACRCDNLPGPLALCVFDTAVNQGVGTAARMLQKTVGAVPDGHIGDLTLGIIKGHGPHAFVEAFLQRRASAYLSIGKDTYLHGWINRVISVAIVASQWDD